METFETTFAGKLLKVKIGDLACQANGEALIQYGDTTLLATCVIRKEPREGIDFFPLTVEYEERYYAAGKIRGSRFIRREARPSDEAVLVSRLVDRTIRPQFSQKIKNDVQVILTCLSWDAENDPDIPAIFAASLALGLSDIPWQGPIAGIRVANRKPGAETLLKSDSDFILNPGYQEREENDLDLVLAATEDEKGEILINMIEARGNEIPEENIIRAAEFSKPFLKKLLDFQKEIIKKIGKEKIIFEIPEIPQNLQNEIKEYLGQKLEEALYFTPLDKKSSNGASKSKSERLEEVDKLKSELSCYIEGKYPGEGKTKLALNFFDEEISRIIHQNIIEKEKRPDGRKLKEFREINCQVGVLPRTHGSGLFSRGTTQVLSILTLGAPGDVQLLEGMEIVGKKRFMHHYNFPPYCVGETAPIRGPGRREIGHGALVERALLPLIPDQEEFPYTIRIVSEILSSNGSSSMASVCASSLALFDAGIPIKTAVAGIAMGLMIENQKSKIKDQKYKVLTDIQGPEDHHGDMDLKVAGTKKGITVMQMDVKILGLTIEMLERALKQAREARESILEKMAKVLEKPRPELSSYAPRILTLQINPEKIREVIGPGGKVINEITGETGVTIDIEDSGLIFITSEKEEAAKKAIAWIKNITRDVKIGEIFQGKVKKILNFGAVVEIFPGQEGLIHISELAPFRVGKVEDIVKIGDIVPVKVIGIEENGKISLSLKQTRTI